MEWKSLSRNSPTQAKTPARPPRLPSLQTSLVAVNILTTSTSRYPRRLLKPLGRFPNQNPQCLTLGNDRRKIINCLSIAQGDPHGSCLHQPHLPLAPLDCRPRPDQSPSDAWPVQDGNYVINNFRFGSGESIPELKLHYLTLGQPHRDAAGHTDNAVLLLHGTGGDAHSLLNPVFSDVLFGPGQPLDITKFYIILPDDIGHGESSKPSDGLRMQLPSLRL